MVEVSGLDCGKFWNVQSLSIVIWTGSGCLKPSITPKYGGSLQNFSTPRAGEAVPSNRAKRMSSGKPSVEPRDIHKETSPVPAVTLVEVAARLQCSMLRVSFNFHAISESASRPGTPSGLSRGGSGTGGMALVQGRLAVSGAPRRKDHQGEQPGLGGRGDSAGPRRRRNFKNEIEAAEFLRGLAFRWPPVFSTNHSESLAFGSRVLKRAANASGVRFGPNSIYY